MAGSGTLGALGALGSWKDHSPQSTVDRPPSAHSQGKSREPDSTLPVPAQGPVASGACGWTARWGQSGKWRLWLVACMACHDLGPPQPALSLSPQADRACSVCASLHDKDAAPIATVCDWPPVGSVRQTVAA